MLRSENETFQRNVAKTKSAVADRFRLPIDSDEVPRTGFEPVLPP